MVGKKSLKKGFSWGALSMAMVLLVSVVSSSVSALSQDEYYIYSNNSIYFYDPEGNNCIVGSIATTLAGDSNAVKIWNWFVSANIAGVSDNAAVIAGIIGNLQQESSLNPLARGGGWGLFQVSEGSGRLSDYKNYMASKGVPESAFFGTTNAELNDTAIAATLEFLVNEWGSWPQFVNGLSYVEGDGDKAVAGFAELFLIAVENAYTSNPSRGQAIQNNGVINYNSSVLRRSGPLWQDHDKRVQYAKTIYETYGTSGSSNNGSATSSTTVTTSSLCNSGGASSVNGNGATLTDYNGRKIAFPLADATKDTVSGGRGTYTYLSNLPCNHSIGCHYGEGNPAGYAAAAFDICLKSNASSSQCVGATVVSMVSGTVTKTIATTRNGAFCNHVRIQSESDGKVIAYMHLEGDQALSDALPVGTYVEAGTVIGHISGVSACHDNSTPHVHIDMNRNPYSGGAYNDDRDPALVPMMNAAYYALPENETELAAQRAAATGIASGGLTEQQAKNLAQAYINAPIDGTWRVVSDTKWNCVSFSAYFVQKFTNIGGVFGRQWGDGNATAHNLAIDYRLSEGTEPRPFSVFSVTEGSTMCGAYKCGHTGIVVAVNGDDVTTVEAYYGLNNVVKVVHHPKTYFTNSKYGKTFTYLESIMDMSALSAVVGS